MKRNKKIIVVLLISIVIFVLVNVLYNVSINKKQRYEVYILNKNLARGDIITDNDLKKIFVNEIIPNSVTEESINNIYNKVIMIDKEKNNILFNTDLLNKDDYIRANEDKEIISIKFKESDSTVSHQIQKNSIVNVYFIARDKYFDNANIGKEITFNNIYEGYATVEVLSKIKILDTFNKDGVSLNNVKDNSKIIDSILLEVNKDDAKLINNLQNIGEFKVTLVK